MFKRVNTDVTRSVGGLIDSFVSSLFATSQNWSQNVDVLRNQVPSQISPFISVRKTFHWRSLVHLDDTFGHLDHKHQKRTKPHSIDLGQQPE